MPIDIYPHAEPHYGGSQHQLALEPSPGVEESKRPGDGLDSSAPHSRTAIQELSEKIRTLKMELVELEDGEPLNSGLELLEGDDDDEDRTLVTASSSDDCSTALVTAEGLGTTEARGNQYSHAETAGGEKTEDGASFSDLERVAADGDGISPTQGPSSSHGSHSGVGVGESQRSGWDRLQADPKLQRAIEKMKKLDTKLDDVVKARMQACSNIVTYSGTPLLWIPWGPGKVENFRGKEKHILDIVKCPFYRGCPYIVFEGCPLRGVPLYPYLP